MAEGSASPLSEEERSLKNTIDQEMEELGIMFIKSGDTLKEAFSPEVRNMLRSASESTVTSSDFSGSSSRTTSPILAPNYFHQVMIDFYRFINEELMEVPTEQQLEKFGKFMEQVGNRLTFPGSTSSDGTAALQQCLKVVKAMKEVVSTRFLSLYDYLEKRKDQGPVESCPVTDDSSSQPREHVPNTDPSGGAHPNAAGKVELPIAGQQTPRSGVPASSSPHGAAEVDLGNRSSSPAKRKPLKRQSHVMDNED